MIWYMIISIGLTLATLALLLIANALQDFRKTIIGVQEEILKIQVFMVSSTMRIKPADKKES